MIKKCTDADEYIFVLNNIRYEDKCELKALFGADWYHKAICTMQNKDFLVLYGKDFKEKIVPVALGGFSAVPGGQTKIACVWLITSKYIYKNKFALARVLKNQFKINDKKYKIMFNYIHKSNYTAKSWLKKFGFRFDNPYPDGMNIPKEHGFFYKVND